MRKESLITPNLNYVMKSREEGVKGREGWCGRSGREGEKKEGKGRMVWGVGKEGEYDREEEEKEGKR